MTFDDKGYKEIALASRYVARSHVPDNFLVFCQVFARVFPLYLSVRTHCNRLCSPWP